MGEGHVWPLEPQGRGGELRLAAIVETPRVARREIWFDVPLGYESWITDRVDPFGVPEMCRYVDTTHPVWAPPFRQALEQWAAWADTDGIDDPWVSVAHGQLGAASSQ